MDTLLTTVTVNTIEVLKYKSFNDYEDFIGILEHCTRLRVFRVESDYGVDLCDLLMSMDETWKCWDRWRNSN
jgi:hypothetical protein